MMGRVSINHGGSGQNTTAVSNTFIESYMTDAGEAQLKVYLYLLYAMSACLPVNVTDLAGRLDYSEKAVLRAIRYWEDKGLVQTEFDEKGVLTHLRIDNLIPETRTTGTMVTPQHISVPLQTQMAAPAPQKKAPVKRTAQEDAGRRQILGIIEQYIGKPLSVKDMETVDFIREELLFSDPLTDYLVQYCVELGKKSFPYIRTVAVNWHDRGITTVEEAITESASFQASKKMAASAAASRKSKNSPSEQYKSFPQNRYDFAALEARVVQN